MTQPTCYLLILTDRSSKTHFENENTQNSNQVKEKCVINDSMENHKVFPIRCIACAAIV